MYKSHSILIAAILVLTLILPQYSATPTLLESLGKSAPSVMGILYQFKIWLWGPDGTITVQGGGQGSNLLTMFGFGSQGVTVNMEPLWGMLFSGFPGGGMEGVLVKANPPDACFDLDDAPKYYTSGETSLDEQESNSTTVAKNWFLIAEDGYCDYNTKIRNADWAGYTVLIIRKGEDSEDDNGNPANSTVIDANTTSLNIYTCTVDDNDGFHLERYTFPKDYTALVTDLRQFQWKHASVKITSMSVGGVAVAGAAAATTYAVVKKVKKNKAAKEKAALEKVEDARNQIANSLPTTQWRKDTENIKSRCKWCHRKFEHDEEVITLPCSHMFHKRCLVPRILRGHGYCPICQEEIHSPPSPEPEPEKVPSPEPVEPAVEKSTESTPLLASTKQKIKEGTITDDGKVKKYHCHICEILGLPLKDELDLVDELARQVGTLQSSSYEYRIPSRHSSLAGSSAVSLDDLADEEAADAEVRRITENNPEAEAEFVQKLHDMVEKNEHNLDHDNP